MIRLVQQHDRRYARRLAQAARVSVAGDEVVAVLVDPDASQWVSARQLSHIIPELRLWGTDRRATWGEVVGRVSAECSGEVIAVLDARIELTDTELDRLVDRGLDGDAAIPCTRAFDGTLAGVGAAHVGASVLWRILEGHPREDLRGLGDGQIEVPLLTGRTFALPRRLLSSVEGWDASLVNEGELEILSIALRRRDPTMRFIADPEIMPVQEEPERAFRARRTDRYAAAVQRYQPDDDLEAVSRLVDRAGFDVRAWPRQGARHPSPTLAWRRPTSDALRWAIKICAPAGRQGAVWGDTHFAEGLAAALRRRGQYVVIDAFDARNRETSYLDDVSVVVRGPYRIDPPSIGISLQWIISHPDHVGADELRRFDRVFAASVPWSRAALTKWGIPVEPLLECTDTDKFFPRGLARGDDIVFVGTARGIPRPSVVAPLMAGVPVRVYGPDWRPFIPASAIAATSIPNAELAARYETASIVLNDQWPAMRDAGFIAMRPFDAVAVGARVISEHVHGIEEVFRGAVVTFRDAAHLVELLRTDADQIFPDDATLREVAAYIRAEHSFDARAAVLHEAARTAAFGRGHSGSAQKPR